MAQLLKFNLTTTVKMTMTMPIIIITITYGLITDIHSTF